jgi:hypothetical protein
VVDALDALLETLHQLDHGGSLRPVLSDSSVLLEDIARLVGHSGTAGTEAVYRKQIRPVLLGGAEDMDRIFT